MSWMLNVLGAHCPDAQCPVLNVRRVSVPELPLVRERSVNLYGEKFQIFQKINYWGLS